MARNALVRSLLALLVVATAIGRAHAVPLTFTGQLAADDALFQHDFTTSSAMVYNFYTTSYGGGINADGSMSSAGGFVPLLTLFSATTGNVLGFGGGSGMCEGSSMADTTTGLCEDASFSRVLAAGSYSLVLSEFPNAAIGSLSDGFLFAGQPTITGDLCGVAGGSFLQTDQAPCVQRTADYAVNIASSPVPEPATWLLVLPAAGLGLLVRRQLA